MKPRPRRPPPKRRSRKTSSAEPWPAASWPPSPLQRTPTPAVGAVQARTRPARPPDRPPLPLARGAIAPSRAEFAPSQAHPRDGKPLVFCRSLGGGSRWPCRPSGGRARPPQGGRGEPSPRRGAALGGGRDAGGRASRLRLRPLPDPPEGGLVMVFGGCRAGRAACGPGRRPVRAVGAGGGGAPKRRRVFLQVKMKQEREYRARSENLHFFQSAQGLRAGFRPKAREFFSVSAGVVQRG